MNHHQLTSFSNKPQMDAVESMRNVDVRFTAEVVWSLRPQWHHQSYYWKTVSSVCVHGNTESEKSACCLRVWESQEVLCVQEWGEWEGKNGWYSHWNRVGVPNSLWGARWLKHLPWTQPHNTEGCFHYFREHYNDWTNHTANQNLQPNFLLRPFIFWVPTDRDRLLSRFIKLKLSQMGK